MAHKKFMLRCALSLALLANNVYASSSAATWIFMQKQKEYMTQIRENVGYLNSVNEKEIKYVGPIKIGSRGAWQNIYIDRKPFGTLDMVMTSYFTDDGKTNSISTKTFSIKMLSEFNNLDKYYRGRLETRK